MSEASVQRRRSSENITIQLLLLTRLPRLSSLAGWTGSDWSSHPLKKMLARGLSVSINSDDPTVFKTSVAEEVGIVEERVGVGADKIREVMRDALEKSFASDNEKKKVMALL